MTARADPAAGASPPRGAFRLRRHFSIVSGIAILAVTLLLAVAFRHYEVEEQVEIAQARNVMMARTFANAVFPEFDGHVVRRFPSVEALRDDAATARLDARLRAMTRGVPVLKIKIYGPDGTAVYSSVKSEIGEDKSANPGFRRAREGAAVSDLTHRGSMSATEGHIENVDVVSTYMPIKREGGGVVAVFELYTDVTDALATIQRHTWTLVAALFAVFAGLYGVLLFVVARADGILRRQYRDLEENERAMQAKNRELAAANRAKSDFLSSTSHELRTPMNAILGFAQLLQSEPGASLGDIGDRYVREILKAGRHLLLLINGILDLARIESGKLTLSLEPVALGGVVQECLPMVQPLAEARRIAVSVSGSQALHATADYMRLKQSLLNLLSNAVKYNRDGGDVEVRLERSAPGRVRLVVRDTGVGIPPGLHERIYEPFQRLSAGEAVEGTGIGLALTRQLVQAMGGATGFESAAGVGSTFWIELPETHAAAGVAPQPDAPARGVTPSAGLRKRLLYIEDNPANVLLMKQIAARMDLEFASAPTGEAGVDLATSRPPHLILMDLNLPGIDGYEALARLRAHAATAAVPVMALSASAMSADVARGLAAGFRRYLIKPFDLALMMDAIEEELRESR